MTEPLPPVPPEVAAAVAAAKAAHEAFKVAHLAMWDTIAVAAGRARSLEEVFAIGQASADYKRWLNEANWGISDANL